ncbi:MAG: hypothetical protein HOV80_26800 [Polyangiaceae bacterium]|nr:hypothetical protein [Polyangiaceae bacterium]
MKLVRFAPAFTLAAAVAALGLAHCSGAATCDAVCDNVLDKCTDGFLGSSDAARNDCVEQCSQRSEAVPDSCAAERDEVLSCLAKAESIDCNDPQRSAACTDENEALARCGAPDDGSSTSATGASGQSCDTDDECGTGLCNWKTGVCSVPAEVGSECQRDEECAGDLCNWKTSTCALPAPIDDACQRDEECESDLCNWNTSKCSTPGPAGSPCTREEECVSNQCNGSTCQ